eukprot:TRINITY_DN21560_c0_g1_i1.p1 TRINITY_DN21560_c0_g1~~TRINITY_DN21560_c0_g1_i1.p1  ORF type:complete len:254 (-),score=47.73 TRINITY_DN21560_c0_g1_i1:60-773(-)
MAPGSFARPVTTSEAFGSFEEDFHRLQRQVREQVAFARNAASSTSRVEAARSAANAHQEADQALQQMEVEARSMGALGSSIMPKLTDYRSELASTRRQVRDAEALLQREGLGLGRAQAQELSTEDQRTSADTFNRLRNSSCRLDDSRRAALEAEEIGMDVMSDLNSQRESILRTKGHILDTDNNLANAKRVMQSIGYKMQVNQLTVGLLAVVLTVAVIFTIYVKLERLTRTVRGVFR